MKTRGFRGHLPLLLVSAGLAGALPTAAVAAVGEELDGKFVLPAAVEDILVDRCQDCHEDGTEKGDIRLDHLSALPLDARLDLLNKMQEQVYLEQMPPPKKNQPSAEERRQLVAWLSKELHSHKASTLEEKLRYPAYGNAVSHEKLFSGEIKAAAYTPARRWLVSPQIFEQRVLEIFEAQDNRKPGHLYGVSNPFLLPDASGVRYYDNGVLDGGHLLVMLTNADWISKKQIRPAQVKSGEIGADEYPDPKDRWSPGKAPEEFEAIILREPPPTREQVAAAIRKQFQLVLRRDPSEAELTNYLELTGAAIQLAGNTEGLRQMLLAVLLESEFLYRLEFGAGEADGDGRRMLSPREATYAISYALGDRGPDPKLLEAAEQGHLASRADYKREVERLLADQNYYRGQIDPGLNGKNMTAYATSHPRIVRFFREFFGYPMAVKVFKDVERGGGAYSNPERGSLGAPGFLVNEADRLVDLCLREDRNVFEKLLTTDEYFVYHNRDNEAGRQIIEEWREVYEKLKDTDWKTDPEGVYAANEEFLSARKSVNIPEGKFVRREFLRHMYFFEDSFGKGRTPFTTISTAHGYAYNHSPLYSLPPSPLRGRYGGVENPRFKGLDDMELWDYPVEQPFKVEHRKGILTHPAWLIAHSHNTHNDPVARGKWVREKLLADRVPDVPITVDAQFPEDHHKTLRTRLEMVTLEPECWKCHQDMNPLGLPFEIYDDFGRYRVEELLEHPENLIGKAGDTPLYKTLPIDPRGELDGTRDPQLDGEVSDALDLIDRLAKSERARQSIIRHAFRFFMGRNEMLSDSQTLIDADRAYLESGGSFKAVIVSLLSSDSFLFRKRGVESGVLGKVEGS
ncbi:MAG: DUF1588 domain-containing protein [Verrucomicrobia bacterium]|nr:DUF1588 domain-containing protein [Verrucomicrobiota bacterium]MDA1006067.1 DUF1588 domain-containing protein [Verrucomicrobiota bacterium]